MSKYTNEHVAAIKAAAADGPLNYAACKALAETELFASAGISAKSIVSKVRVMEIDYEKVVRKTKTGKAVRRKPEIVVEIENSLGIVGLESLAKADKMTLERLAEAVAELTDTEIATEDA